MPRNRLILDTDGGVDDAQALLMLIAGGRPPDAITTVFGNVSLADATENILAVLAVAGADIPVHPGAAEPLAQERIEARHVHGEDGLGGAPRPDRRADIAGSDAVGFLGAALLDAAGRGDPIDLLMVGPLTNLALVLQAVPEAVRGIGQLTVMGGTVFGRGNVTPAAEFNIFSDPEAAAIALSAPVETTLVPWEACLAHALPGETIDPLFAALPDSAYKAFLQTLVDHDRQRHVRDGLGDCIFFVDPLAAAVVLDPDIVTRSIRASLGIALEAGITRGMTVVDPSGRLGTPPVTVVEAARLDRLADLFAATVAYAP